MKSKSYYELWLVGYDGQDVGLSTVIESLRFVFSPCTSPACLLEDLAKAMRHIQTSRNLVGNGHSLLSAANGSRPEHERYTTDNISILKGAIAMHSSSECGKFERLVTWFCFSEMRCLARQWHQSKKRLQWKSGCPS